MEKLLLRPAEAAEVGGVSRPKTYELVKAGLLPTVMFGRAIRIPTGRLREWVEQHTSLQGEPAPGSAAGAPANVARKASGS